MSWHKHLHEALGIGILLGAIQIFPWQVTPMRCDEGRNWEA